MRVVVEMAAIYLFSGITLASMRVAVEMAAIYLFSGIDRSCIYESCCRNGSNLSI